MGWPEARNTAPSSTLTWYVGTGFTAGPPPRAPPPRPRELLRGAPDGGVAGGAQRVQRLPQAHGDAGEDRRVAERVGARLRLPQLHHEVEEVGGLVRLEGDDELLVVQPVGV